MDRRGHRVGHSPLQPTIYKSGPPSLLSTLLASQVTFLTHAANYVTPCSNTFWCSLTPPQRHPSPASQLPSHQVLPPPAAYLPLVLASWIHPAVPALHYPTSASAPLFPCWNYLPSCPHSHLPVACSSFKPQLQEASGVPGAPRESGCSLYLSLIHISEPTRPKR